MGEVLAFREARDWGQFHRPKELAAALAIEAGEVQELFLWRDGERAADVRGDASRMAALRGELADVTMFLLLLGHELRIDLPTVVREKLALNERRYAVTEHKGVAKKGRP